MALKNKNTKSKKWILYIVIFLLIITTIRLTWNHLLTTLEYTDPPSIEQGVLDLRGWEHSNDQTLPLTGEWEFYPSVLISPEKFIQSNASIGDQKTQIQVPNVWNEVFADQEDETVRYGTYRLRILLDEDDDLSFGLRINEIRNASAVYGNDQLLATAGEVATEIDQHQARIIPYTVMVTPENNEINVIIHASSNEKNGGITESIRFGTIEAINKRTTLSVGLQLLLAGVLLFHSFYAFILYFLGAKTKVLRYFSLFMLCAILSVLVVDDKILYTTIYIEHEWAIKLIYIAYIGVATFLPHVMGSLFTAYTNQKILRAFSIGCALYVLFVLISPFQYIVATSAVLLSSCLIIAVLITLHILIKAFIGNEDVIFILFACSSIGVNILWSFFHNRLGIESMHYPFDLIFAVLAFSAFWFRRFFQATNETKQLAEKLQLEDRRKDLFLMNTSHELRNPLYGMTNMTQSVLDDQSEPISDKHRKRLEITMRISKHMSFMLDDLLDLSRLKENRIRLQLSNVRVQSVIFGITDMIRFMLEGKPIRLEVDIPKNLPTVVADENRLIQILFNLMHNAVKYTNEGTITVRAKSLDEQVHIQVEDTGIGIEEEFLQNVFHAYEQASINDTRSNGGFGLGLSISKQLVALHGGTFTVQSVVGKGTVFTFTLPHATEDNWKNSYVNDVPPIDLIAANVENLPKDTDSSQVRPKILVVDDDSVNLKTISYLLNDDYTITSVTSAEQVIALLEKKQFDLVISDVMMPNISGYELTRLIRERFTMSELPVLLLTTRSRSTDILTGFQVGANDYVKKPIDGQELKARVRALIDLKVSVDERLRMESAWMQSQIQPHFLYNTLNSIAALSVVDNAKMQTLLEEFSNYLRFSFDFKNTDPVILLEHELMLVRSYLYIEKVRFGDRLHVKWEIDASDELLIPPLSIQPLVENAVRHGVMQRIEGGTVSIRIEQHTDHVTIFVTDDGKGIPKQQLNHLLTKDKCSDSEKGVGILNVHHRLKQLYGKGLTIESVVDQGTKVSFHIPLQSK